jgi:putative ABC transport system permease protein
MSWMATQESISLALDTLRKNKLRSGLTILGISIGIATVILISSAINGLNTNVSNFIKSLGTNTLWVFHYDPFGRRPTTEELNRKRLTLEEALAIRQLPYVVAVDAQLFIQNFQTGLGSVSVRAGTHRISNTILYGDTTQLKDVQDFNLIAGRMWTEGEEERASNVVVLGHDAAEDLFPDMDPIGKDVDVEGDIFTVIGVLDLQPQPFGSGRNTQDNSVYFPLETFHKIHPEQKSFWLIVKYDNPEHKAVVTEEVRDLLRVMRGVRVQQDDNFTISGPDALSRLWGSLTGAVFLFMVAVSSVGLMVGGVGVMNIMLVSVTERTREIGIRKAIGATKKNILLQFTLEAVTLCAVGGVLGILAGSLFTLILYLAVPFLHARLSAMWMAVSLGVSALIGLVFGIYPAWTAASLDPIEALRYE